MSRICSSIVVAAAVSACFATAAADENWPNWRGPSRTGASDATGLPATWSENENVVWRTPMPSWSGSSPVIWGDNIFLTSPSKAGNAGNDAEQSRGRRRRRMTDKVSGAGGDDLLLLCVSRKDGAIKWKRTLGGGNKFKGKHNMASPSPATDGKVVVTLTGTGVLTCHDVNGRQRWQHNLQEKHGTFGMGWGYASSPLIYKNLVIVEVLHQSRGGDPSYLAAFETKTGKLSWKVERKTDATRECPDAYTTPTLLEHDGKTRLIISGADYVTAHDPETGKEIWRAGGLNPDGRGNYRICGTPVAVGGMVYATSRNRPVLGIRAGGRGNVTESHVTWRYDDKKGPDVPSIACDGKLLYLIHDRGFATCLDAKTGKAVWGPERIASGPYSASPLVADGRVYATNEDGVTTVLATGREFKKLHENTLSGGYTLSSIAVSGKRLYLRTAEYLYCLGKSGGG